MELQISWFVLVFVLLTGYAILDGFDLGVGFWHLFAKKEEDRGYFMKAIGPFWDGNEVWLLTGGGALFAAFPPVYATTFSGFYLAIMLVLFGLIFRICAIEFRSKIECSKWMKVWDVAFAVGSSLPALLFGVAVGNVVRGIPMDLNGDYTGTFFQLLNPYSLIVGVTGLMMFAVQGATFLNLKLQGDIQEQSKKWIKFSWFVYLPLLVVSLVMTLMLRDHASNLVSYIVASLAFLTAVSIPIALVKGKELCVFLTSSLGILINMIFVACSLFPYWVPGRGGENSGLTIYNSSSSSLTLTVMLIFALVGMPVVIGYTVYLYKVFAGKVN